MIVINKEYKCFLSYFCTISTYVLLTINIEELQCFGLLVNPFICTASGFIHIDENAHCLRYITRENTMKSIVRQTFVWTGRIIHKNNAISVIISS